jgi:membrane-associated protease RseP (regulator of RpoE activity)
MRTGWRGSVGRLLAVGVLGASLGAAPVRGQQNDRTQDCRCVDSAGKAIDNCTCFRMPDVQAMVRPFTRPRLGISVSTSQGSDLDRQGAQVTHVLEDGPAADAGLRENDVITSIDGHSLFQPLAADVEKGFDLDESLPVQRLLAVARDLKPGQKSDITYLRDGQSHTTTVEAKDLPGSMSFNYSMPTFDADHFREQMRGLNEGVWNLQADSLARIRISDGFAPFAMGGMTARRYGLEMVELNPDLGHYFGATQGVLVTSVDDGSTLGLHAGDVISSVDSRDVDTPERVTRILRSYGQDENITFRVRRDGRQIDVQGRLSN